jgi:glyoxylase-like metal-dependent hydrolase (beta-lactamase superfamily II)
MIAVGRFQLFSVINGWCRLDGGAMFGVVPKEVWASKSQPDEQNRILLATRTLVGIDGQAGRVVLADTGPGSKWPEDQAARFGVRIVPDALSQALARYGLGEGDVTDVVIPHLHFDHAGGLTEWAGEPGGETRLRFPQARHWIHEKHWQHANHPTERDRASFLKRDLEVLAKPGVLTMVSGDDPPPPFEGVRWQLSHGHTPYQLLPLFEGDPGGLLFVGDMIPTKAHLPVAWVMGYDLYPLTTLEERREVYRRCAQDGLMLAFPHDPECGGVAVDVVDGKPVVSKILDL